MIDNSKGVATDILLRNNLALYKAIFGTDDLVIPKMYAGFTPFRVLSPATYQPDEIAAVRDSADNPMTGDKALIFGCTPKGWQRSLTASELKLIDSLCCLWPQIREGQHKLGYGVKGMSWVPAVSIEGE